MVEMKTLLISSLGDMKREIQTIKSDVYAKEKKRYHVKVELHKWSGFPAHQPT